MPGRYENRSAEHQKLTMVVTFPKETDGPNRSSAPPWAALNAKGNRHIGRNMRLPALLHGMNNPPPLGRRRDPFRLSQLVLVEPAGTNPPASTP
jgi:hypothetical protein